MAAVMARATTISNSGDSHQSPDALIAKRRAREIALDELEAFAVG
jgi:hypothetical protein